MQKTDSVFSNVINKKIKLAFDSSWLGVSGIGRVANEVISRTPHQWELLPLRNEKKNVSVFAPLSLTRELTNAKADLFWSPGFMPPLRKCNLPVVLTIHDLTHLHYYKPYHRMYYEHLIRPLLYKVDKIITVSDYSRQEILKWSGLAEDKVVRIYNGLGRAFSHIGPKFKIDRPYILYVGNRRTYKNLLALIQAFYQSNLVGKGYCLALSGFQDEICRHAELTFGLAGSIHYLGFIPEDELPSVYRGASALAFVSLYEGFGLPILEAMGCGVPVLTSTTSSMPEVAADAALLVDPTSISSIAAGLRSVVLDEDLRHDLISRGQTRSKLFSWDNTASQYWDLFTTLVSAD